MAKKYLEVINNGAEDLYILDNEAREAIGIDHSHEFVDLGLPSGTLWAKCNVGAASETDYGKYYMYGKGTTEYDSSDSPYTGTENPLASSADTATQVWGAPWHMPTKEQFEELLANTNQSRETNFNGSGISGRKLTSKTDNTKYIFFPDGGMWNNNGTHIGVGDYGKFMGSTPKDSTYYYGLELGLNGNIITWSNRSLGVSVRPVCNTAPLNDLSVATLQECAEAAAEITFIAENN